MLKLPFALVTVISTSLLPFVAPRAGAQQQEPSRPSFLSMDQAIHDYILAHPEIMLESIRNFDLHRKAAEQPQARRKIKANLAALQSDSPASSAASSAHPVTIVEFFDYRCGFCKKVQPTVAELAARPSVRFVYKDLPILGPDSVLAARAALAAESRAATQRWRFW